jgi:hypothetical protein
MPSPTSARLNGTSAASGCDVCRERRTHACGTAATATAGARTRSPAVATDRRPHTNEEAMLLPNMAAIRS